MPEEKKRILKKSWREKKWFKIVAPSMFGGTGVGETLALEPEQLIGRVFETTLGDLIGDFSKSHIKLYFQVSRVDGERAMTDFVGHEMVRDYIRSQVRRRVGKVDNIQSVVTQDSYKMRVSAMVTTVRRVQSTKLEEIRREMRKVIEARADGRTFDQFIHEMVLGKLSSDIYKAVKRYCPIHKVEVYKSKVLSRPA